MDMGATRSLRDNDKSGEAMEATAGALLEADRRMNDPIRKFQFWRKVYLLLNGCAWSQGSVNVHLKDIIEIKVESCHKTGRNLC